MWVFFAAHDYCIGCDEDGENAGQDRLHGDENHTCDCLGGLGDAEFFDEDEDADYGQGADDLDENVDYVAGASLVGSVPDEEAKHWWIVGKYSKMGWVRGDLLRHSITS